MISVLHIGIEGSTNLGDEAITQTIRKVLKKNNVSIETLSFNFSKNTSSNKKFEKRNSRVYIYLKNNIFIKTLYDVLLIPLKNFSHIVNSYKLIKKNERIIIGGGNILMGYDLVFPIQVMIYTLLSKWLQKEIVFLYVGYGPFKVPCSKKIIDYSLARADRIVFRDSLSAEKYLYGNKDYMEKVCIAHDPVMIYSKMFPSYETLNQNEVLYDIVISVLPYKHPSIFTDGSIKMYESYIANLSMLVSSLSTDYKIGLIATDIDQDRFSINDLYSSLDEKVKGLVQIVELNGVQHFSEIILKSKIVLSTRMHSAIMGFTHTKPVIALSWQQKVDGLFKDLAVEENLFHVENINSNDIKKRIDFYLKNDRNLLIYEDEMKNKLLLIENKIRENL